MFGLDNRAIKRYIKPLVWILAVIVSLPIQLKGLTGLYVWLSPFVVFDLVVAQRSVWLIHIIALLILLLCVWKKRWFCKHLCFVGWSCRQVARLGKKKNRRYPALGKYIALFAIGMAVVGVPLVSIFDPLILFRSFFSVIFLPFSVATFVWGSLFLLLLLSNLIWGQGWCQSLCPLGGFQEVVHEIPSERNFVFSRRVWLTGAVGIGGGLLLRNQAKPKATTFRPPSALPDETFYTSCLRCGNCVNACPANIIQLNQTPNSVWEWQTPMVNLSAGYCWSDCNACGQVCPGGALRPFSLEEKKNYRMGTARLQVDQCRLSRFKECDRCFAACSFDALRIETIDLLATVVIDKTACVGCGACMQICPENAISIQIL